MHRQIINRLQRFSGGVSNIRTIITSTYAPLPIPETNFAQHLLRNASQHSDRVAMVDGITATTFRYSELVNGVSSVASALTKKGVKRGDVVCIYSTNSTDFVFALLGALSTGASVTLTSASSTPRELAYQLKDSKPRMIFAAPSLTEAAKQVSAEMKDVKDIYVMEGQRSDGCLDFRQLLEDDGKANPLGAVPLDAKNDVALLPYSSGTTGLPKGVMLTHANVGINIDQFISVKPTFAEDICLMTLPMFHIYGISTVLSAAVKNGGKLVVIPKFEPITFLSAIDKHKVNKLHIVPPICLFMLHHPAVKNYDLSSVESIMCGAAPLDRVVEDAMRAKFGINKPNWDIYQGYGLSETSPITHINPSKDLRPPTAHGSVGVVVPNEEVKVMSISDGKELGPKEDGHIVVRGPHVMKGYLGREQETRDAIDADGWFSTGDIGHYDEHGYFFIVDRMKDLIKVKGLQVAPAELEAILLTHPAIDDCAVIGQKDARHGEVPVAFVVKAGDITEDQVKTHVAEHVSKHKRLEMVKFVTEIPRNPSGKILRRKLRDGLA